MAQRIEDWQAYYQRRLVSADEAVQGVKSGDRVAFVYGLEPLALGMALAARKEELRGVKVFVATPGRDFGWYDPGWEESFAIEIGYILPIVREMAAERRCDYLVSDLLWARAQEQRPIDFLLLEISPPDEHGFCSFGASLWNKKKLVRQAKTVLAEVNPNLMRTFGENYIHVSEIGYFVEHIPTGKAPGATDLLGRKTEEPGETMRRIAEYTASLINNGDTLQIGVGSTSEWVARVGALDKKNDLGWHSETTPRGIIKLVRQGVITGKCKTINTGKAVAAAFGGGTKEDMEFVHGNPMFELQTSEYVLDPRVISAHDNMVAINAAVAVDLTGQIAAESIGPAMVSGTGGQLAFAIGTSLSKGGRAITVLPSTARGGAVSRTVPMLEPGTVITVPRALADCIVTEYGIAQLRGKTQRERAQEMINIAHPDFRPELERAARELYWP